MALISIRKRTQLAEVLALAPERYDPRRELQPQAKRTTLLRQVVQIVRQTVQPSDKLGRCLVLDTSDAREGIMAFRKEPVDGTEIGSAKKIIEPKQVIISRLRSYLRQVALVAPWMKFPEGTFLLCSTEFFVLSGIDGRSILNNASKGDAPRHPDLGLSPAIMFRIPVRKEAEMEEQILP